MRIKCKFPDSGFVTHFFFSRLYQSKSASVIWAQGMLWPSLERSRVREGRDFITWAFWLFTVEESVLICIYRRWSAQQLGKSRCGERKDSMGRISGEGGGCRRLCLLLSFGLSENSKTGSWNFSTWGPARVRRVWIGERLANLKSSEWIMSNLIITFNT